MNLFFRKIGDGPVPVIILHGLFGSCDNWLTVGKNIAAQLGPTFSVYLVDQRNHGRSPHEAAFDYHVLANDLRDFVSQHQLTNPILVGHSMGGKVVMQYALSYPGTFKKLVVVDIAPRPYPVHHSAIMAGLKSIDLARLQNRQEAETQLTKYEPDAGVRQFLLKNLYRNDQNEFCWRINLTAIEQNLPLIGAEITSNYQVEEPALFIRGDQSKYIRDGDWAGIERLFPNATLATIQGAGHWVQAEKPAEFTAILIRFLVQ